MINQLPKSLLESVQNIIEKETEYQKFFKGALKKFGVTSPKELSGDKEKEFYNYVDANWKGKSESVEEASCDSSRKKMKMEKTDCPKCEGNGCNHCDNTGYHEVNEEVEVEESLGKMLKGKIDKDKKDQADAMAKVKAKGGVIGKKGSGVKMKEEVELDENYEGNKQDFKYEVERLLSDAGFNPSKTLKGLRKKGKKFEVDLSVYFDKDAFEHIAKETGAKLLSFKKGRSITMGIFEEVELEEKKLDPVDDKGYHEELDEAKTFKSLEDWMMAVFDAGGTISKSGNTLRANGLGRTQSATWELKKGRGSMLESVELDENKKLLDRYQELRAKGKKDHNIIDVMMSDSSFKRFSRDQMTKIIGDALRSGKISKKA